MAAFDGDSTRRKFLLNAAGGAAVMGLAACGGASKSQTSGSPSSGKPVKGGTLTIGQLGSGANETLNLGMVGAVADYLRVNQVYEALWQLEGDKFGAVPHLVKTWETNADATLYTLNLRDGVTWHDGKPFTADDVIWTIKSWEKKNGQLGHVAPFIDFGKIRKRDKLTVELPLVRGLVDLPTVLAGVYGSYVIQDGASYKAKTHIGTGPFKLDSFEPGRAVFSRNSSYWDGAPYLDKIVSDSSFRNDNARYNALLAGKIDAMPGLPFGLVKTAKKAGNLELRTSPSPGFVAPYLRIDQAPFNDPRVVQAIKLLVDREAVLESVFDGVGSINYDVGQAGVKYHASDLKRDRDVEQAKSLLKAAGQSDLRFKCITAPFVDGAVGLPTVLAEQFKEGGVNMQVQQIDVSQFFTFEGPFAYLNRTSSLNNWQPNSLASFFLLGFNQKAPFNPTHWGGPKEDALLFDALSEKDEAKATDKWHEIQKAQFDRGGQIIPTNQTFVDATSSKVKGVKTTPCAQFDNYNFRKAWKEA